MNKFRFPERAPLVTLVSIGLGLGLLLTGFSWLSPTFAKNLFSGATWFWVLFLVGTLLVLLGVRLGQEQRYPAVSKPALLLAVAAATALVYLFPELFAPGCKGMPRAFAACPAACRINTCSDWASPGERGCDAKPPNKGCCFSYETTCDPDCSEPDPDPDPTSVPDPTAVPPVDPTSLPGDPTAIPGDPTAIPTSDPYVYDPPPEPVYDPPSISGAVSCALPGSNGWCKSGAMLNLNADDPQGFSTTIYGDIAGTSFSCAGPNCSKTLSPGSGIIHFQSYAHSSGKSSGTGSASFAFDPSSPSITFAPTGTTGTNGWYTSPVFLQVNAVDTLSGVESIETRMDSGSWILGSSLVLSDGEHSVEARATDNAGNQSTVSGVETIGLNIDTVAPSLTTTLSGKLGLADWYVSDVTVSATVSDSTSGLALTEYRLDDGNWQTGTSINISADGPHTVDFRATDQAGNQTSDTTIFKIDQTLPDSGFVLPLEDSAGTLAQNQFSLGGKSIDATSGLASVQISTDEGLTWLDLPTSATGEWKYVWETRPLENGLYPVLARAEDQAGNIESTARVTLLLANHPPKVSIQDSWWIWDAGSLSVKQRFIPISEIRVRIACLDGQPDVKLTFTPETIPAVLSWDRKCGQGQFATAGDHPVTLGACDKFGNCAEATGLIKVPFVAPTVPTWTPTMIPTTTSTPAATKVVQKIPQPTATILVHMPVVTPVVPPAPTPAPEPEKLPKWFWATLALVGFLAALTAASLSDPRPRALRRLGKTMNKVRNGQA